MTTIDERGDVDRQVLLHLARTISRGVLREGEVLPETEALARELLVGPRRVAAAVDALIERGAAARSGTAVSVAPGGEAIARAVVLAALEEAVRAAAESALHDGCTPDRVGEVLSQVGTNLRGRRGGDGA